MGGVGSCVAKVVRVVVPVVRIFTAATPIGAILNTALLGVQVAAPKAAPFARILLTVANPASAVEKAIQATAQVAAAIDPQAGAAVGLLAGASSLDNLDFGDAVFESVEAVSSNLTNIAIIVRREDLAQVIGSIGAISGCLGELPKQTPTLHSRLALVPPDHATPGLSQAMLGEVHDGSSPQFGVDHPAAPKHPPSRLHDASNMHPADHLCLPGHRSRLEARSSAPASTAHPSCGRLSFMSQEHAMQKLSSQGLGSKQWHDASSRQFGLDLQAAPKHRPSRLHVASNTLLSDGLGIFTSSLHAGPSAPTARPSHSRFSEAAPPFVAAAAPYSATTTLGRFGPTFRVWSDHLGSYMTAGGAASHAGLQAWNGLLGPAGAMFGHLGTDLVPASALLHHRSTKFSGMPRLQPFGTPSIGLRDPMLCDAFRSYAHACALPVSRQPPLAFGIPLELAPTLDPATRLPLPGLLQSHQHELAQYIQHASQPPARPPSDSRAKRDLQAAFLAKLAYQLHPDSCEPPPGILATRVPYKDLYSWERVNLWLTTEEAGRVLGPGWQVLRIDGKPECNRNHCALVHYGRKEIWLLDRGTQTLVDMLNDVCIIPQHLCMTLSYIVDIQQMLTPGVVRDPSAFFTAEALRFGGTSLFPRISSSIEQGVRVKKWAEQGGYTIVGAVGHSLGGYLACARATALGVPAYNVNGPIPFHAEKVHHISLLFDVVSWCGKPPIFAESESIYLGPVNPLKAHSIDLVFEIIDQRCKLAGNEPQHGD